MEDNNFRRLWALGYRRLVPIIPPGVEISEHSSLFKRVGTTQDGRGKTPGVKRGDGRWSSWDWAAYEADEEDLDRWHRMGAGSGIKTGAGLVAIDADTLDLAHAQTIRNHVEKRFGKLPIRIGNKPKALYLARVDGPLKYTRVDFGKERVELLTDGRQFVAAGVHPKTGRPYEWSRDLVAFDDLPSFSPETFTAFMRELAEVLPEAKKPVTEGADTEVSQAGLRGTVDAVRRAVAATPNTSNHFPTRESYRDIGYAIKAALPDDEAEAFEIWAEWGARWDDGENKPEVMAADWSRMHPPYRRGASWLYDIAEQRSLDGFTAASAHLSPVPDDFELPDEWRQAHVAAAVAIAAGRRPIVLTPFLEAAGSGLAQGNRPLIKGLLDRGTFSVMYGPSNVGKTFVAMNIAFHVGTGMPYDGMKVLPGAVLYVAAEGGVGARRRALALMKRYPNESGGAQVHFLLASIDLLRPDADLKPLIAAILAMPDKLALLVLDTLSRAMAGGDENSPVDMGAMVKHIDTIRAVTGAHVLVIHHSGKDVARGARGHSLLRAATDTEIEVSEGQIDATKQRDLERSYSASFELVPVVLGVDEDGADITSCTVSLVRHFVAPVTPATATEEVVLSALRNTLSAAPDGTVGVKAQDLVTYLSDTPHAMTLDVVRFHLKSLAKKNLARAPKRNLWSELEENRSSNSISALREISEVEESGGKLEGNIFD